ncbi:hypothetical protein DFJ74DRAFT_657339 [Hyaloraphidium curvatum]|nr:hypothetical protein DFJ74DRAFT_657339 [Hyaloraphidium curvatum]
MARCWASMLRNLLSSSGAQRPPTETVKTNSFRTVTGSLSRAILAGGMAWRMSSSLSQSNPQRQFQIGSQSGGWCSQWRDIWNLMFAGLKPSR